MKKFIAICLCFALLLSLTACSSEKIEDILTWDTVDYNIENYKSKRESIANAAYFLPTLEVLGEYSRVNYSYQHTEMIIFQAETIALYVEYTPEMYRAMKKVILSSGNFLEQTLICADGASYQTTPANFTYRGYQFKTGVSDKDHSSTYCKEFILVGMNDEKCRIAFCYFYDMDLDYIDSTDKTEQEAITKFMDEYFAWNDFAE